MPVGNDVVDLNAPETRPGGVHPRFDTRVFTPDERGLIPCGPSADRIRWALWAAKESAFKAARQIQAAIRFIPRQFEVDLEGESRAEVTHDLAGRFAVRLEETAAWIHAVATPAHAVSRAAGARVAPLADLLPGIEASQAVRRLAVQAVSTALGLPERELRVVSTSRVPSIERKGEALPVDLSLSHHGRFVACAWKGRRGA